MVGQQLIGDQTPDQEEQTHEKRHSGVACQRDICLMTGTVQQRAGKSHKEGNTDGDQCTSRCETAGHQQLGVGQLLAVRNCGQDGQDHHIVTGIATTDQTRTQHNDNENQCVGFETTLGG